MCACVVGASDFFILIKQQQQRQYNETEWRMFWSVDGMSKCEAESKSNRKIQNENKKQKSIDEGAPPQMDIENSTYSRD